MELHEHYCCDGKSVYKGSWTPHEDELLNHYMEANGHRRHPWKDVPKYAGLLRCGKSCRFRWLHYLRPTLNREHFRAEEIKLIRDMQRTIGNKWAEIAKFLPGRSDNSIKKIWYKHCKKKLINKYKNPTSSSVDPHSQPDFNNLDDTFSSTGDNFSGYMNETEVHHHGDSIYDLTTLNNNPPTYMIPTQFQSSPTKNQQILQDEYTLSTNNNLTHLLNNQLFPSLFFHTPPINHHRKFHDNKSTFISYDLPPLPDSILSQRGKMVSVPTCEICTKSTYFPSLYNGENSLGWIDPRTSYDHVPEKYQYHESNQLYDPSLLVPGDPTHLMRDPPLGVIGREFNNHNMVFWSQCLHY